MQIILKGVLYVAAISGVEPFGVHLCLEVENNE